MCISKKRTGRKSTGVKKSQNFKGRDRGRNQSD
nr:MAG TPA: hypothetical protein [Bacteriophage sp.]